MSKDNLGDRMKEYELVTRSFLPRRSYVIIRVDGVAFHTYTKGLDKPFDERMIGAMNHTAEQLCKTIPGAKLAFIQSDEISLIITDFDSIDTEPWYGNNILKMCSVSASRATRNFNEFMLGDRYNRMGDIDVRIDAEFDSRVYQIPQRIEVLNYLKWRQLDTMRNSISSVAYSLYSHKELEHKNSNEKQEMIFQKGINWNDYDPSLKRGRIVTRIEEGLRSPWKSTSAPDFLKDDGLEFFLKIIPENISINPHSNNNPSK